MSHETFRNHAAMFFTSLAAFLGAIFIALFITDLPDKPIITSYGPFEICENSEVVQPGGIVCYKVNYFKRLDIPGDITKQLILRLPDGEELYVPLADTAGHLPPGIVKKKACVRLPDWLPDGIGKIKLSASYNLGNKQPSRDVAFTKEFEVRR
jgi:hypothetical protein